MEHNVIGRRQLVLGSIALATSGGFATASAAPKKDDHTWSTLYDFDITWSDDWILYETGSYALPDVGQEHIVLSLENAFPDGPVTLGIDLAPADPEIAEDPLGALESDVFAGLPSSVYSVVASDADDDGAWLVYVIEDEHFPSVAYAEVRIPDDDDEPLIVIKLSGERKTFDVDLVGDTLGDVEIDDGDVIDIGDEDDVLDLFRTSVDD